ncbi:MAG: GYF domain-containing protein [Colwellia sp.]|nr:GYF domain-containing protein [Colwellia sp.]
MKEWFFSKDGEISGPLDLAKSNDFIAKNPDVYAWHPSYAQWMPISAVDEFDVSVPYPKPPREVPKELIEGFISKERELSKTLGRIDNTLKVTTNSLSELDQDIDKYKQMTKNLNEEVRNTIRAIEQQFAALQKNLSGFKENN